MALNHSKGARLMIYGAVVAAVSLIAIMGGTAMSILAGVGAGIFAVLSAADKKWGVAALLGGLSAAFLLGAGFFESILNVVGWLGLVGGGVASFLGYRAWKGKKIASR